MVAKYISLVGIASVKSEKSTGNADCHQDSMQNLKREIAIPALEQNIRRGIELVQTVSKAARLARRQNPAGKAGR